VAATVVALNGYRDVAGIYHPVVGIFDPSQPLLPLINPDGVVLKKTIAADVKDTYYRVTFDANGGTLVGPSRIPAVAEGNTLPYLPISPIRTGYTFRYWATQPVDGTQFTADTSLDADVTVYAIWDALPVAPEPPAPLPPTVIVNNPPANGPTYVAVESGPETETETLPTPQDNDRIGETAVPVGPGETAPGWSLFNLLAAIASLLLLVVFFIKFFFDRPRDEEYEEEPLDGRLWEAMTPEQRARYQARRDADYQVWLAERTRKANCQKVFFVNVVVLLIAGVAMIEAMLILFGTQNFDLAMRIVDDYSVFFLLIVFVQLLAPTVAAIIRNNKRGNFGHAVDKSSTM
jgi:hypothetical protein